MTLVSTDKISQTIAVADADFSLRNSRAGCSDVDAKGNFSYLDFLQGAYGHELIGRVDGVARFALIPEKISWVLQEDFGQAQVDPFTPVTPTNRENVNYVSTGPDLDLRLGSLGFVDVTARYARTQYQTSPFDSNRLSGQHCRGPRHFGGLHHRRSTAARSACCSTIRWTIPISTAAASTGVTRLRVRAPSSRANLGATQGRSGQRVDHRSTRETAAVAQALRDGKADVHRRARPHRRRHLPSARCRAAPSARSERHPTGIGTAPAAVTSNNYTVTYASVGWQYARNRTTFGVSGQWEKDSYEGQPLLDLNRGTAQLSVERRLTQAFTAQLIGSVYRTNYAQCRLCRDRWIGRCGIDVPRGSGARDSIALRTRIACRVGHRQRIYRESRVLDGGLSATENGPTSN